MWVIFAGLGSAARAGSKPRTGQQKRYGPVGVTVTALFVAGAAVAYPAFRVFLIVCAILVASGVIGGIAYGFAHRNDTPAARKSTEDKELADIMAQWRAEK